MYKLFADNMLLTTRKPKYNLKMKLSRRYKLNILKGVYHE